MHERIEIVIAVGGGVAGNCKVGVENAAAAAALHVGTVDLYESAAVGSRLFVIKAERMKQFVDNCVLTVPTNDIHNLDKASHSDRRIISRRILYMNVIG